MIRICWLFIVTFPWVFASPLRAQEDWAQRLRPLPPKWLDPAADTGFQGGVLVLSPVMCPALKGLLGGQLPEPKTAVQLLVLPDQRTATLMIEPIGVKQKGLPVRHVLGAVELSGPPPVPEPVLLLQLHVVDTLERPIDQRQLILTFEDSTWVDFGSMGAYRLSAPGAHKVEENLTTRLPAMEFRRVTRATTVRVQLGDATFLLTKQQLDGLRALYATAICGGRPR